MRQCHREVNWTNRRRGVSTFLCAIAVIALAVGAAEAAPAPSAPSSLSAVPSSSSHINLSWTDNSNNETGFKVERSTTSSGPFSQIGTTASGVTTYGDTGLLGLTTYYYRVRAYNTTGDSNYSNTASAKTLGKVPTAPSNLTATAASSSQINLSWTDNAAQESGFKVESATSASGPFTQIGTTASNVTTFASSGLTASTTFYFRVRAYNTAGDSGYSNSASATTQQRIPNAPSSLTATAASSTQINLSWTDNAAQESGFKIERSTSSSGPFSQIGTTAANVTTYANSGLTVSTAYYYRVRAYNTSGDSGYSNTASATTQGTTMPAAPSNLTATAASSSQINLAWTDNASNETGFKVERSTSSSGPFSQIGTTAAGVTTYGNSGLTASTAYYYRVRAYNTTGDSGYSNTASATTQGTASAGAHLWSEVRGPQSLTDVTQLGRLAVDASGNIFVVGRFSGTADLGGGRITSGTGYDIYIAKYSPSGAYLWARHFDSSSPANALNSVAIDSAGNVLVAGTFWNTLDFGAPCAPITSYSTDSMVVKFSTSGSCVWARNFQSNNGDTGMAIAVDGSDNVILSGGFNGTLNFGNGQSLTAHTGLYSTTDIYLAKFNSNGVTLWAHDYGQTPNVGVANNDYQTTYDVAVDGNGDIAMTGSFKGTVDFCAPGPACPLTAAANPLSGPSNDAFIAKYSPSGAALWVKSFGDSQGGDQVGQAVSFDAAGNILAAGQAAGAIDFGNGSQPAVGAKDLFVAKLASSGQTTWAHRYGAVDWDQHAFDIAVDGHNDVIVAASTSGPVDFGAGPVTQPSGYRSNALGLKLSSATGSYVWAKCAGDTWYQYAYSVATDSSSNVVLGGILDGTMDLGGGLLSSPGPSTDAIFLAKFQP
jgi:hypothetical protein